MTTDAPLNTLPLLPACIHCGLCLPSCPTYAITFHEADSPRGRIQLMLGLSSQQINLTPSVQHHLELCLDCRGCETACPSGVVYHLMIERHRETVTPVVAPTASQKLVRWVSLHILTHPGRLKLALLPARLLQKAGLYALLRRIGAMKILPAPLRKMEAMLPPAGSIWPRPLPANTPPIANRKSQIANPLVALLSGCVGAVLFTRLHQQAIDLLSLCGARVIVPAEQGCCGAIHHHNADPESARALARRNIDAFLPLTGDLPDFITTTIAGCGAALREYGRLLADDPAYAQRAADFAARVRDISEVLLALGLPKPAAPVEATVTCHDACHLVHAQKVTGAPRQLLASIPGLKLVPLTESDLCCGAAGTYNLTEPEMAGQLAERKLANIRSTGCDTLITSNAGCALHIGSAARVAGLPLRIVHPVELLHEAYFPGSATAEHQAPAASSTCSAT